MSMSGEEKATGEIITIAVDSDGLLRTKPEGVYLVTPPTLVDGEQHRLTLTEDAKLRTDDPTTQSKIDEVLEIKGDGWTDETLKAIYDLVAAIPGGVDWSVLTPKMGFGISSGVGYTTILDISGAGYLTGVALANNEDTNPVHMQVTIDGIALGVITLNYWGLAMVGGMGFGCMHRFDSSLKIEVQQPTGNEAVGHFGYVLE